MCQYWHKRQSQVVQVAGALSDLERLALTARAATGNGARDEGKRGKAHMAGKSNGQIKAIETVYKGYRFRSRLEARWAVFFDALGVKWEYEPQGFELEDGTRYLPDFWIDFGDPHQFWIEIKAHKDLSNSEVNKALGMSKYAPGFIFMGYPELPVYKGHHYPPGYHYVDNSMYCGSWAVSFGKFVEVDGRSEAMRLAADLANQERLYCWHERKDGSFLLWPVPAWEPMLTEDPKGTMARLAEGWIEMNDLVDSNPLEKNKRIDSPTLKNAYTAARQARFEYGENGAPQNGKV